VVETGCRETVGEGCRFDRHADIAGVEFSKLLTVETVRSGKYPSGPQNPGHLREQLVLGRSGWNVVKHGEGQGGAERALRELQIGGVTVDDHKIVPGHSSR
jgi:hypothetical protein